MLIRTFSSPKVLDSLKRGFETDPEETGVMLRDHVLRVVAEVLQKEGSSAALKVGDKLRKEVEQLEGMFTKKNRRDHVDENQEEYEEWIRKYPTLAAQVAASLSIASQPNQQWRQSADFARLSRVAKMHVIEVAEHSPASAPALIRTLLSQGHRR